MKMIRSYLSLVKFSHTVFSLPFALIGFAMAITDIKSIPSAQVFIASFLCVIFARNAAMAFNRFADRNFDKLNTRTNQREIPQNKIKSSSVLIFTAINIFLFIASTWFINSLCFYLSPIAIIIILTYSLTKRFTWLSHFVLGMSLMLAPLGTYLAVAGFFSISIILIGCVVLFWVAGFDILYSIQDIHFDRDHALHSIPSKFGDKNALWFARGSHFISSIALLFWFFERKHLNYVLGIGVILFILLLIYQHFLIRPGKYNRINAVFFLFNGIASIILCTFYLLNLL